MKIVFFGTPEFALPSLKILNGLKEFEIVAVVTQKDKKKGRKNTIIHSPIKQYALKNGLKIIQEQNTKDLQKKIKEIKADIYVVIAFGMILSKEILKLPKYGAINVHASLLPKYRGASPIQQALLNGDKETGIAIIQMDEKMDHGKILMLQRVLIKETDNAITLSEKISHQATVLLPHIIKDFTKKEIKPIQQNDEMATYCKKIKKEDGLISKKESAEKILNMIRAYTKWPQVYIKTAGKTLKILEAEKSAKQFNHGQFTIENGKLYLGCKKDSLLIKKLQFEGKKEINSKDFINGYRHLIQQ